MPWRAALNATGYTQRHPWTYGAILPGHYGAVLDTAPAAARGLTAGALVPVGPTSVDPEAVTARELADSLNTGRPILPPSSSALEPAVPPDLEELIEAATGTIAATIPFPTPAASWSFTNPLPYPPAVTVVIGDVEVIADVERTGDTILITHATPAAGRVYLS